MAIASATVEVTARLDKLDARLREGATKVEGFVKKHSRSFDLFGAGIKISAVVGAVKSVTSLTEAAIRALRGEFDLIDEALRRLPFGIGEAVKGIKELWRAIEGAPSEQQLQETAAAKTKRTMEAEHARKTADDTAKAAQRARDTTFDMSKPSWTERYRKLWEERGRGPQGVPTTDELEKQFFPSGRLQRGGVFKGRVPTRDEYAEEAKREELFAQAVRDADTQRVEWRKQMDLREQQLYQERRDRAKQQADDLLKVAQDFGTAIAKTWEERVNKERDRINEEKKYADQVVEHIKRKAEEQEQTEKRQADERARRREAEQRKFQVHEVMRRLPIQDRRSTAGFGDSGPRSKVDIAGDGLTALKRMQNQMKKDLNTRGVLR